MQSSAADASNLVLGDLTIRASDPTTDNGALCKLSRLCPQGRRLRFFHARKDHWERCHSFARSMVLVAEADQYIVGAASIAWKHPWISSAPQPVAYFFDRLVHPDYRRRGIGRALLRRQLELTQDTHLQYSLVLEENTANRRLLESEGFTVHPQRLLYFAILPSLAGGEQSTAVRRQWPISANLSAPLRKRFALTHEFVDEPAESGEELFTVGELPGAAAVRYAHGPKVFVQAPWYFHCLGLFLPFIPRTHRPILSWELSHLHYASLAYLRDLLAGVAHHARQAQVSAILIPLYDNDPRIAAIRRFTVNRWGIAPTGVCLYLRGKLGLELFRSRKPLLASARDG